MSNCRCGNPQQLQYYDIYLTGVLRHDTHVALCVVYTSHSCYDTGVMRHLNRRSYIGAVAVQRTVAYRERERGRKRFADMRVWWHEWDDVLQCVAVCCSVLQCVAVCCSVLQCVACRKCTSSRVWWYRSHSRVMRYHSYHPHSSHTHHSLTSHSYDTNVNPKSTKDTISWRATQETSHLYRMIMWKEHITGRVGM